MVNISIVLFKQKPDEVLKIIDVCVKIPEIRNVYLIDNSPMPMTKTDFHPKIEYIFNGSNLGYGAGHNVALKCSLKNNSPYHLVLNPDVIFEEKVIIDILGYMNLHTDVGLLMPKVYYNDGTLQRLCKLLPSPLDLFYRRFMPKIAFIERRNKEYEIDQFNYDHIINSPNLSGCFMFIRTEVLRQTGLFDPRYFMYLEDVDLVRRIHKIARTVFYPDVGIIHSFKKGSYQDPRLLLFHTISAIKYFSKWGWFNDSERMAFNNQLLDEIEYYSFDELHN
jgi:GT2 family glycosyltransferase